MAMKRFLRFDDHTEFNIKTDIKKECRFCMKPPTFEA